MLADMCPRTMDSKESKFRVLYLGNDVKLIAALRQELHPSVYRVVTCADRESAVLFLKSEIPYDVLLIDLEWRGEDGAEVARLAHSLRHRKRMPIVLLAATKLDREAFIDNKEVTPKAGVQECVLKTEDIGEVIRRMVPET